nr:hypothetical protein [Tanacetum cinerariifolium]
MMDMIVNNSFRFSMNRNQVTIRTMMYPDVHENPLTNDEFEAFMKANDDKMYDLQIEFDHFQKQCEQMQDDLLNQMRNFIQNFQSEPPGEDKEHEATTNTELFSTEDIHPLPNMEKTMFDLVKICHHKQFLCIHDDVDNLIESALDSKLLSINSINSQRLDKKEQEVKIVEEQPAERRNHAEKSLQNFRVIHKSSISLNTSQISLVHAVVPILSTREPENSLSMGYEHLNITPETTSDEVIESNAENLLPIPSECEVALEDKRECDLLISENSPVCDNSDTFSDSKIDDDISVYDDDFENIEYVESSLSDPEIVSVEEENVVQQEEEEVDLEDISQVQDVVLREKLFSITQSDNSLSDNFSPEFETFCDHTEETRSGNTTTHADDSIPEYDSFCFEIESDQERLINVVKNDISDDSSNDPLLEEADLFLASDNSIPPDIENFADDSEGDVRFLEALLIDDSIPFPNNESSDSDFDNPSFLRPPPKPPDAEFEIDAGEEISVVMNDKLECLDPRDEFDDDDYYSFMFVIYSKVFSFLLSAESEDTIFDPGISI